MTNLQRSVWLANHPHADNLTNHLPQDSSLNFMENESASWGECMQYAAISDVGMRRQNNQDSMNVMLAGDETSWHETGHLFLVADGMGAHAAGELASKLAADGIPHTYSKLREMEPGAALAHSIRESNANIYSRGQADPEFEGMGTTCSAMLLTPSGAVFGHVGDSRAYRLRGNQLEQLTFDHSLVWEMRAAGQLTDESEVHVPKNIITRSLGPNAVVQVDVEGPHQVLPGDRYLLCSDGLTGPVTDEELGTILGCLPPEEAVQALVDLGNLRGGPDNITIVVVQVDGPPITGGADIDDGEPLDAIRLLLWMVTGVSAIAAIATGLLGLIPAAIVSGIVATVALILSIVRIVENRSDKSESSEPTQSRRGPYASFDCTPGSAFIEKLEKVIADLRKAAEEGGWKVDWDHVDQLQTEATRSVSMDNPAEAVHQLCRAIVHVVEQLRRQRDSHTLSDSHVDLI